jgi:hypothetical protein
MMIIVIIMMVMLSMSMIMIMMMMIVIVGIIVVTILMVMTWNSLLFVLTPRTFVQHNNTQSLLTLQQVAIQQRRRRIVLGRTHPPACLMSDCVFVCCVCEFVCVYLMVCATYT